MRAWFLFSHLLWHQVTVLNPRSNVGFFYDTMMFGDKVFIDFFYFDGSFLRVREKSVFSFYLNSSIIWTDFELKLFYNYFH